MATASTAAAAAARVERAFLFQVVYRGTVPTVTPMVSNLRLSPSPIGRALGQSFHLLPTSRTFLLPTVVQPIYTHATYAPSDPHT